jgi:hypothetical protein
VVHEIVTELLIQMYDYFGIGLRIELVAAPLQIAAQLDVIKDFAVVAYPNTAVLVANGLLAAGQVNDAKTGMTEADSLTAVVALSIGSAMADGSYHLSQEFLRWYGFALHTYNTCYSTPLEL